MMVKKSRYKQDISNRTVVVILVLTILISVASLFIYLDALHQATNLNAQNGPTALDASQVDLPTAQGKVSLQIIVPPEPNEIENKNN